METGRIKLGEVEARYGFLLDSAQRWTEFWYEITPDHPQKIAEQIRTVETAEAELFKTFNIPSESAASKRFFSSDLLSHYAELSSYKQRQPADFFFSVTEQPPAVGGKIALLGLCLSHITAKRRDKEFLYLDSNVGVQHIFAEHLLDPEADEHSDSEKQTAKIFRNCSGRHRLMPPANGQ